MATTFPVAAALAIAGTVAACSVSDQEAPGFIGPSGMAMTVSLAASPDQLPRDGASRSFVTVTVQTNGQPVANQRVSFGIAGGTLSTAEATTDPAGRATVAVTAPAANVPSSRTSIEVSATPVDASSNPVTATRFTSIGLTGLLNTTAPTPSFTVDPAAPSRLQLVVFDASATQDEGAACSSCSFAWDFGGEAEATGRVVTHRFAAERTYAVTLTVTDVTGTVASLTRNITVSEGAPPSVGFTFSPAQPAQFQTVNFTAETSRPGVPGRIIRSYDWQFGDGATASGQNAQHAYGAPGTYTVTLTVTDDAGARASSSQTVTVSRGAPTATISFSPTDPVPGQTVTFRAIDATASGGAVITSYEWDFGDGSTASGQSVAHAYVTPNTFEVRLTMTDSTGRVGVVTQTVTVDAP